MVNGCISSSTFLYLTVTLKGMELAVPSDGARTIKLTVTGCGVTPDPELEPEPHPAASKSSEANPSATAGRR